MSEDLCRCLRVDSEPSISSAGILCYAIPPDSEEIFFLLGKECIYSSEADPVPKPYTSKAMWCDFSGGRDGLESAEETAAREFFEESLGTVAIDSVTNPLVLTKELQNLKCSYKITMCSNYGAEPDIPRRYHVTFVKQIEWNPNIPREFERILGKLTALQQKSAHLMSLVAYFAEKNFPLLGCPIDCRVNNDQFTTLVPVSLLCSKKDSLQWEAWFCLQDECGENFTILFSGMLDDDGAHYADYLGEITSLEHYYQSLPLDIRCHPAIYRNEFHVWTVFPHYLEKTGLMFWNASRIRSILDNGIQFRKEYFRPSFIPTLAVVLDLIQRGSANSSSEAQCYSIECLPISLEC